METLFLVPKMTTLVLTRVITVPSFASQAPAIITKLVARVLFNYGFCRSVRKSHWDARSEGQSRMGTGGMFVLNKSSEKQSMTESGVCVSGECHTRGTVDDT